MGVDVNIDPMGEFEEVVSFINNNANVPQASGGLFISADAFLPTAQASASSQPGEPDVAAMICWDLYIQDLNTKTAYSINGLGGVVTSIRFGGPDPVDGVPATNIAFQIRNPDTPPPTFIWQDTGVAVTVGEWFRVCVRVDDLGNWEAGIDADGAPGTSSGDDFDNYTVFASGASRDTDTIGGNINSIAGFTVLQGFDDEGDGVATIDPMQINARAANAARPVGIGAQQFCFYQIVTVNAGGMTTPIQPVNPVTAVTVGGTRNVAAGDAIAVQFDAAFGVTNFDECPRNGRYEFRNVANTVVTSGTWVLTGVPDVETAAQPPDGGISNADGIADGFAYNFEGGTPPGPNAPYRTALLATYRVIPSIPEDEINSRWWLDNLHLQAVEFNVPVPCPADLNGDGNVNSADLALLLGAWGQSGVPADINGMGGVNSADLALLLGAWGPCPE